MTQKQVVANMAEAATMLKRGMLSIYECEQAMTNAILDGVLAIDSLDIDKKIALTRKLKRRMWKMLLEATK